MAATLLDKFTNMFGAINKASQMFEATSKFTKMVDSVNKSCVGLNAVSKITASNYAMDNSLTAFDLAVDSCKLHHTVSKPMSAIDMIINVNNQIQNTVPNSAIDSVVKGYMGVGAMVNNNVKFYGGGIGVPVDFSNLIYRRDIDLPDFSNASCIIDATNAAKSMIPQYWGSSYSDHYMPNNYLTGKAIAKEVSDVDIQIAFAKEELKSIKKAAKGEKFVINSSDELKARLQALAAAIPDAILMGSYNYDFSNLHTDESYAEFKKWQEKRKEYFTNLIKKYKSIRVGLVRRINQNAINKREVFRKINSFLFKNLDDSDSPVLVC